MAEMHHEVPINAPPERVYEALTTQEGLSSWWTADTVIEPIVGGRAEFGFVNRTTVFRMRIDELEPDVRVVWTCLGDPDEWEATKLIWDIRSGGDASSVRFTHADWREVTSLFAVCNSTWGELMYRLKDYLEGREPGPRWKE